MTRIWPLLFLNDGNTHFVNNTFPKKFTSIIFLTTSSDDSYAVPLWLIPPFWIRISMQSNWLETRDKAWSKVVLSDKSNGSTKCLSVKESSLDNSIKACSFLLERMSLDPSFESWIHYSLPMPELAPVTQTTLSLKYSSFDIKQRYKTIETSIL